MKTASAFALGRATQQRQVELFPFLLHHADLALLQAKRDGRNHIVPWTAKGGG